jgi:TonB-linked SusC/RagA family outer membrane protein
MKLHSIFPKSIVLMLTCLLFFSAIAQNPSFTVTGKVIDENGKGLPGVTVTVKGSTISAVTGADGIYRINAASGKDVLVFSYIGYQPTELAINKRSVVDLSLSVSQKLLDDVVVIGYGTQKKNNVSFAVSKLKNDNFDQRAITRVDQALVGQLAGVTVKQSTGVPGKAFSIQVRGTGSISGGNEPLYVLDGFPLTPNSSNTANGSFAGGNPLDNINPNDIESIEVLKDAAAAAIYGSRASNGVVLITTRRGQTGKPRISFNAYAGYNQAAKKLEMMNGQEWIDHATEIINATYVAKYGSVGATANDDRTTRLARLPGGVVDPNYILDPRWAIPGHPGLRFVDWQDEIERKGRMENYELSASGGTEAVKYFISGNYANQDGFVMGVGYKAYSLRANIEINASKRLKFGLNIAPTYSITQDPGVDGKDAIFHQALSLAPVQEDTMGVLVNTAKNGQYIWSSTTNSPVGKLSYNKGTTKRYRTLGTIYGELQIVKGLNFRTSVNLDNTDNNASTYVSYLTAGTQAARTFTGSNNLLAATSGTYRSYRRQTFVNENTLNYTKAFDKYHSNLNVLAGYSYNFDRLDQSAISSNGGYTSAVIQTLNAAAAVTGNTTSSQSVLISYFSRLQYAFKDKYLLLASLRKDGTSRAGANNRFETFPAASLAWRISQENFMQKVPVISDLKLRLSYGVNGNIPSGDYGSIATLGSFGYPFGATPAAGIGQAPNVLGNPDLQWEKSKTYDIGLDFGILHNRITGSFDYYNKLNTELLLNVQVLAVTGFPSYLNNTGSVRNIGQEFELTSRNLVGKFQWTSSVTFTHNTNKIVALGEGQTQIIIPNGFTVSDQILRVGSPLNSIYVLKINGFLTAQDIANNVPRYTSAEGVGDFKFEDINGDGTITEADKQIVGHPNPDYTYGITNTFRYKGFDLNVLVQGQWGGSIYSQLGRAITRPGQGRSDNHPASFVNRWYSESNTGDGRFGKAYSTYNNPITSATDWLYSSDYIRVRNITLGYNLKALLKKNYVQNARLYLTLENFFGHDKYINGLNPEAANTAVSSNAAYPESGDYGGLPLAKSFIVGLNITF